jgi:hypothetical protein
MEFNTYKFFFLSPHSDKIVHFFVSAFIGYGFCLAKVLSETKRQSFALGNMVCFRFDSVTFRLFLSRENIEYN